MDKGCRAKIHRLQQLSTIYQNNTAIIYNIYASIISFFSKFAAIFENKFKDSDTSPIPSR